MTECARQKDCPKVGPLTTQVVIDFELRDPGALADLLSRRFSPVKILPVDDAPLSASGTYGTHAGIDFSRTRYAGDFAVVPQHRYDGVFFYFPVQGHVLVDQGREQLLGTATKVVAAEGFIGGPAFTGVPNAANDAALASYPGPGADSSIAQGKGRAGPNEQPPAHWPTSDAADAGKSAPAEGDAARLLALMRQEMSAFGSDVGAAELSWRKEATAHPMDFFA